MENAAEALKIAGFLLIFIVALGICMNTFSQIVYNVDSIITDADREYSTKYVEGNRDSEGNLVTKRIVSVDSIVPTIYRSYKDARCRIVFPDTIFQYYDSNTGTYLDKNYIDISELNLSNDNERKLFIKRYNDGK